MKPTTQLSSEQNNRKNFPVTDFQYQSPLESSHANVKSASKAQSLRSLWKLSASFFGGQARFDDALEFALFGIITALSVWPVFLSTVAVVRMMENY